MKRGFLRKLTYIPLVLLMVVSLVPVFALTASAADYNKVTPATGTTTVEEGTYIITVTASSTNYAVSKYDNKWVTVVAENSGWTSTTNGVSTEDTTLVWEIAKVSGTEYYTLKNGENYIKWTASTNGIAITTTADEECYWTISAQDNGTVKFISTDTTVRLSTNNSGSSASKIRAYKATTIDGSTTTYTDIFTLHKLADVGGSEGGAGEEGGDTTAPSCEHANTTPTDAVDATCTAKGNIAYYTCNDCGKLFDATTNEEITENNIETAIIDHNYVNGTCTMCSASVPLGYTFDYKTGTNSTVVSNVTKGLVTLSFSKGTGSTSPTWYSSGNAIRFYTNNTLTISTIEGYYIKSITITFTQGSFAASSGTISDGTWTAANNETTSVVFTNTSSTQARVNNIAIELGAVCKHTNTEAIGEYVAPSCTEAGMSAGSKCSDCGEVLEKPAEIEATGHTAPNAQGKCDICGTTVCVDHDFSVTYTITEPTCTVDGEEGLKCSICGEPSDDKTVIPATGHSWVSDTPAVNADCTTAGSSEAKHCSVCDAVVESETIEALGHSYFNGKCKNCGEGQPYYCLVTDVSSLAEGDKIIIVAKNSEFALSTTQNNNRPHVQITKHGNTIFPVDGVQILTLANGNIDGTFAFNTGNGYLYAASSSSNYLKTQESITDNSSWTIEIATDGVATVKAQGTYTHNWLRYNIGSKLFSCYADGQQDIAIYKLVEAPSLATVGVTLNHGVTLNVVYNIPASWFAMNADAQVVFKAGSNVLKTIPATSGTQVYSYDVTPGYLNDDITVEIVVNDTTLTDQINVSLKSYKQKFEAASYESLKISEAKYNAIIELLDAIMVYADAADEQVELENTFDGVDDFTITNKYTDDAKVLANVGGELGAQASLTAEFANIKDTYNVEISVNGVSLGTGRLIDNVNDKNQIIIKGISAVKFNDIIFIEVTEDIDEETPTVIASLSISFNQYFKFLNTSNYKNLAIASYLYGLAAENYLEASAE